MTYKEKSEEQIDYFKNPELIDTSRGRELLKQGKVVFLTKDKK